MAESPAPPLRPELLFILLAVAREPVHGYALLEEVRRESGGDLVIRTGSLYRFLGQLIDEGLIREVPAPRRAASAGERRRYYGITKAGRVMLAAEVARLKRIAMAAESVSGRRLT